MDMEYQDMLKFIYGGRKEIDDATNGVLQKCGEKTMQPDTPAADPEILKQQRSLFSRE